MKVEKIKHHPQYGELLHEIKMKELEFWQIGVLTLFIGFCMIGYAIEDIDHFNTFDAWSFLFCIGFLLFLLAAALFSDREATRFIIYENGFWAHEKIRESSHNFVPWKDIDRLEAFSLGTAPSQHYVLLHVFDKEKYKRGITLLTKIGDHPLWVWRKPLNYIRVSMLNIKRDELYDLLQEELMNWREKENHE